MNIFAGNVHTTDADNFLTDLATINNGEINRVCSLNVFLSSDGRKVYSLFGTPREIVNRIYLKYIDNPTIEGIGLVAKGRKLLEINIMLEET